MKIINWSKVFGYETPALNDTLQEFCEKYYNYGIFKFVLKIENYIKENIVSKIRLYNEYGQEYGIGAIEPGKFIETTIFPLLEKEFGASHEPNGPNTFPDYIINSKKFGEIYFDSKAVMCRYNEVFDQYIPSINNACGSEAEIAQHILNHHQGNRDLFYLSFIIYTFYNEADGAILDIKVVPMISSIYVPDKNWDINKIRFNIKSRGTDGQVKNSNVTLNLPSFTRQTKTHTLEEQEALLSTAAWNYLKTKNYYE